MKHQCISGIWLINLPKINILFIWYIGENRERIYLRNVELNFSLTYSSELGWAVALLSWAISIKPHQLVYFPDRKQQNV